MLLALLQETGWFCVYLWLKPEKNRFVSAYSRYYGDLYFYFFPDSPLDNAGTLKYNLIARAIWIVSTTIKGIWYVGYDE